MVDVNASEDPPAIATPLIKGGRGDLNTIYSIQEVCCVSPEFLEETDLIAQNLLHNLHSGYRLPAK